MNVYFDATPSGLSKYGENYRRIARHITQLGYRHTNDFITRFDQNFYRLPESRWADHYQTIMTSIEASEVMVVEISMSSLSLGICIHHGMDLGKPIVVMVTHDRQEIFLRGAQDLQNKLIVVEYSLENLEQELESALKYASEWLESRFTLILNRRIRGYLDRVTKSGKTRSEYIRELIEADMKRSNL